MRQRSSKELADELDAQDRLLARGFTKEQCKTCRGLGQLKPVNMHGLIDCPECEGRGFHWQGILK